MKTTEIKNLFEGSLTKYSKCLICVTSNNEVHLIKSENDIEQCFDGSDLENNITNYKNLPIRPGVYTCVIVLKFYKCNHQLDPVEWDCEISIENCELLDIDNMWLKK